MEDKLMFDIAIVGLGATGVSLLSHIQNEAYRLWRNKTKIAVFNPASSFASGKAFGDAAAIHKVNTPPWMMSVTNADAGAFATWLDQTFNSRDPWPPRLHYSQFIRQTYQDIKKTALLEIEEYQNSVVEIEPCEKGYSVGDAAGNRIRASYVVMCLGAKSGELFAQFKDKPGFITHFSQYDTQSQEGTIIAGTGLTAIDAFRFVWSKGRGKISLYSRSGYAPTCLTRENRYTPVYLNWRNILAASEGSPAKVLDAFTRLLRKEFSILEERAEYKTAMNLLRSGRQKDYFSYLLQRAENADLPWQDVLVSTRLYMDKLWNALPVPHRLRFMKHYSALWAAWRHPVPQAVFAELVNATEDGRLRLYQAICNPEYDGRTFNAQTSRGKISAPQFWDGTGGSQHISSMQVPILESLSKQNLIEANVCGGMSINPLTYQCQVKGKDISRLYNLGPLNKGCLFSTNAFWFNALCAKNWARQWAITNEKENPRL